MIRECSRPSIYRSFICKYETRHKGIAPFLYHFYFHGERKHGDYADPGISARAIKKKNFLFRVHQWTPHEPNSSKWFSSKTWSHSGCCGHACVCPVPRLLRHNRNRQQQTLRGSLVNAWGHSSGLKQSQGSSTSLRFPSNHSCRCVTWILFQFLPALCKWPTTSNQSESRWQPPLLGGFDSLQPINRLPWLTALCSRILLECLFKVIQEHNCFCMRNISRNLNIIILSVNRG